MSIRACQIVEANTTGCGGRDLPVCVDYTAEQKVCRKAPSEDLAKQALHNVINGNCKGESHFREIINSCKPKGRVWTEAVKPNLIQKIGIIISDFLSGIFN